MPSVTIMPCLDLKDGRVVKGVHFVSLQDVADPVAAARVYADDGAKELTVLNISAAPDNHDITMGVIRQIAEIPGVRVTAGGGVASVEDAREILKAGAHRVSVSSAAVRDPELIDALYNEIGSERIVVAIDVDRTGATPSGYEVVIDGGRTPTGIDAIAWAKDAEQRGAGILLPTSKTTDGAKQGYDIQLIQRLKDHVTLPIVASGGAGTLEHFLVAAQAGADFLLAASVFHFGDIRVSDLRAFLEAQGVTVM